MKLFCYCSKEPTKLLVESFKVFDKHVMQWTETPKLVCELWILSKCPYFIVVTLSSVSDISAQLCWNNRQQCSFLSCFKIIFFCFREHGFDVILNVQLFITRGKSRAMLYLVLSFLLIKYELLWNFSHHLTRHNTPTAF